MRVRFLGENDEGDFTEDLQKEELSQKQRDRVHFKRETPRKNRSQDTLINPLGWGYKIKTKVFRIYPGRSGQGWRCLWCWGFLRGDIVESGRLGRSWRRFRYATFRSKAWSDRWPGESAGGLVQSSCTGGSRIIRAFDNLYFRLQPRRCPGSKRL